jgi:hypothetical protein
LPSIPRTIVIGSLCIAFVAGCGSKTPKPIIDRGLAQPPQLIEQTAQKTAVAQPESRSLAVGTVVPIRFESVVDSAVAFGGYAMGTVESDVNGADGQLAIPAGSSVAMVIRESKKTGGVSTLQLGLYSTNIAGHQYALTNGAKDAATVVLTEDAGHGSGHTSVHIQYGDHITFKLDVPVQLH